ncbi:hypothetical protein BU15DRAFT_72241 [Melanogaster broomeanus]|nr:hypothetical protein BU15DRAFT_72241 [Melanogaster broomeanus]
MTKTTKSRTSPIAEDVDIDAPRMLCNHRVLSLPSKSCPAGSVPPFKVGPPKGVKKSSGTVDNAEGQHMKVTADNVPLAEVDEGRNTTLDPASSVPLFKVGPPKHVKKSRGTVANTIGQHKKVTADDALPAEGDEGNSVTQDTRVQTTEKVKDAMIEAFEARFRSPRPSTVLPLTQNDRPCKRPTLYTTPLDSSVPMTGGIGVFDDQEHQEDEDHIDDQRKEVEVEAEAEGSLQDDKQQEEDEVSTVAQGLPCDSPPSGSDYGTAVWVRPLYWQWTTKNGPNAGKTFKVPTIPTHCPKGSCKAISWLVNAFHSFKAHLTPSVLHDGKVPKPLLQIYQSNMPVAPGAAPSTLNPEKAVLHSQAMSPPPSAHPISDDTSLVESLKALYASAISWIAALEAELAVFHSNPQALLAQPIPSVGTSLTSATPSLNPFTIAAGLIPAAKQSPHAQPVCKTWVRGTAGPTGSTHPTT